MNRNAEYKFGVAPHENMNRSVLDLSHSHITSFNVGDIIPICCYPDVLPGDTISIKTSKLVRLQTLLAPIFNNLILQTYWFFVPNRLVWNHWAEFMGENKTAPWTQTTEYTVPQIVSPTSTGWTKGTIADFFGIPTGVANLSVNALPFRAYALTCSEWFRNENTTYPINVPLDDTTINGTNGTDQVTDIAKGGAPFKAAKLKDYFTACLPAPQKGNSVTIPGLTGTLPVITTNTSHDDLIKYPMQWALGATGYNPSDDEFSSETFSRFSSIGGNFNDVSLITNDGINFTRAKYNSNWTSGNLKALAPDNLIVQGMDQAISVNQLRLAFQIQKLRELEARTGTRYIEIIKASFGTISPDARMQRPEYLGGSSCKLDVRQVVQTSGTEGSGGTQKTPQGHTAAYSVTGDVHGDFSKSFTEHGTLLGLAVVRYKHVYQQGLSRGFSRTTKYSYYWPMLANIGEQPVYEKELYCTGNSDNDDVVFGYNEAWADYRYQPNIVSGEMRSNYATSLDSWHLADEYSSAPALSSAWIQEDKSTVDRVLAINSSISNQLFGEFYFDIKATRVMPVYSIPGLIDHH